MIKSMKFTFLAQENLKNLFKNVLKFAVFFLIIFAIMFTLLNWPAVKINVSYYWGKIFHQNNSQKTELTTLPNINNSKQPTTTELKLGNNRIVINKININVPIVWNVPEKDFIASLKNGVAHYQGTAKPGDKGNIFIAGHSSNYWWEQGPYSAIFSMINKLDLGDEVIITYNNKAYYYRVQEKFTVKPSQVEVMMPTKEPTLTLMTCTPIGTSLNRLIVRAHQVIP